MAHRRERLRCLQELGLAESASEDDIKKAYRAAAIKYHPDKNREVDTTSQFQKISAAYRFLTEGDAYLNLAREGANSAEFSILRFLFPWLFQQNNFTYKSPNPFYHYYDDMSDDDDDDDYAYNMPNMSFFAGGASGASQYYQRNTNFTHTSAQHGQFFQENQPRGKAAKKKNKEAKRAAKLAADREKSEPPNRNFSQTGPQGRAARAKSPTPDLSGKQKDNSPPGKDKDKSPSPAHSNVPNNPDTKKDNAEEQPNKKSKKQIQMEQKQREKELKEINEELLRQEKEKQEKMDKKRAIQEEKERQEREARQKEEEAREEQERQRVEELRILLEKKEDEKKRKKREAEKMRILLEDFDSNTFLDENGDFKYTDPEMKNIIRCEDVNSLGNATKNRAKPKCAVINDINPESLIKLQEVKQVDDRPQPPKEKVLGSPPQAKLGPVGSRPQNPEAYHRQHSGQQSNHFTHNSRNQQSSYPHHQQQRFQHPHQQRFQHPHQQQIPSQRFQNPHQQIPPQQFFNRPPPPRYPAEGPFWSQNHPPPPLRNTNTNIPRPSDRFSHGYLNNMTYQKTRTFTPRGYQGNS